MSMGFYAAPILLILLCSVAPRSLAVDYQIDWQIGGDYRNWATNKNFMLGDNLVFNYAPESYAVMEINGSDYGKCRADNPIFLERSGHTIVHLNSTITRYFMCPISDHCEKSGMQLFVSVPTNDSQKQEQGVLVVGATNEVYSFLTSSAPNMHLSNSVLAVFIIILVFLLLLKN